MNDMGVRHGCRCGALAYFCGNVRLGRYGLRDDGAAPRIGIAANRAPLIPEILCKRREDVSAHWRLHPRAA
jgi:hypothetical protein